MKLTDEQMRVAIAEACGWKIINGHLCKNELPFINVGTLVRSWEQLAQHDLAALPDYLNSLDAMYEAEAELTEEQQQEYGYQFLQIVESERTRTIGQHGFQIAHATARQRAEAFLKAIAP